MTGLKLEEAWFKLEIWSIAQSEAFCGETTRDKRGKRRGERSWSS
jgi:hypothetical protein